MKMNIKTTSIATVLGLCLVTAGTSNAAVTLINPIDATASSAHFQFGAQPASAVIDATDLNLLNEHSAEAFPANGNWLSDSTTGNASSNDEWIFVDLGSDFDTLESVNIWNYGEASGVNFVSTDRAVVNYELWVAGAGATLPSGLSVTPYSTLNGWTQISTGALTAGPTGTAGPFGPTDVLSLGGNTGIRYVGIDIVTYAGDGFGAGLAQIQVTAVPEPSSAALLGLGGLALILRRRK